MMQLNLSPVDHNEHNGNVLGSGSAAFAEFVKVY